jgi:hypothetical protein
MASPSPIFVSPSTTIVQVNPLLTPYTPVILNAYNYAGQVVTVLDGTSSFGVLQSSIVVSTANATQFNDGSISTLINQPQGFLTLQAGSPNLWSVLNSFPFRNQYLSAGTQNLTTSTLYAASLSTIREFASTVIVKNLLVSGNLSLSAAITLNQSISSLGVVNLFSTFTAYGSTFFSSGLCTLGAVTLFSSLSVDGNLTTRSSLQILSSMYVSGSVLSVGPLSTSLVNLSGSLTTVGLISQTSTIDAVQVAGSILTSNLFTALSTFYSGSNLTSFQTSAAYFSSLSSFQAGGNLLVTQTSVFQSSVSTQGTLAVGGLLSTGGDVLLTGGLVVDSNLTVAKSTLVKGFVSSLDFLGQTVKVLQNFQVNPTLSNPTRVASIEIQPTFGFGSLEATSTTIGGTLSTTAYAVLSGDVFGQSSFVSKQSLTVGSSFSTFSDLNVGTSLNASRLYISGQVLLLSNIQTTTTSYWNMSTISSSLIQQNLNVIGNLTASQTMILSSITLPSSVLANSFEVSTLFTANLGITNNASISSLRTSSLATGGIFNPEFTMDMSNVLYTYTLSTFLLSSLEFLAQSDTNTLSPSSFFRAFSSFGVKTIASTNTFDVNTIAYTLCNTNVEKTISTQAVYSDAFRGVLNGDGLLLSNTGFPASLSTSYLRTSTLNAKMLFVSSFYTSTLQTDLFLARSTLTVGQIFMFGNAASEPRLSTNYIAAPISPPNLLYLNNLSLYGDTAGVVTKQAVINSIFDNTGNPYTLAVGGGMRVDSVLSPSFALPLTNYFGDIVVASEISTQNLFVNSGSIGISSGSFFIPESDVVQMRSTNLIQPSQSTLIFNSTLYVSRQNKAVGVNTFPYYTLDVKGITYAGTAVTVANSTFVTNKISMETQNTYDSNSPRLKIGRFLLPGESYSPLFSQIEFYNSPDENQVTFTYPYIITSANKFDINRALVLTTNTNIVGSLQGVIPSGFESTFYQGGSAIVSGFVSTNEVIYNQGFYMNVQTV